MLEQLMTLSVNDLIILNGLVDVAKEAKQASEIIRKAYRNAFGIGENQIEVWSDGPNYEYLTHDGVWQARYLHQTYDVKCTEDEIFKYFRAEYMIKNGFEAEYENGGSTEMGELKRVARYFRHFVLRASQELEEEELRRGQA